MAATIHVKAKLIPWDDPAFVRAFEQAHGEVEASGCCPGGMDAAVRVEHLLREAGYPAAQVDIERTVPEALEQVAHWTVRRDA
jgi:hypothetical protein